MMVDNTVCGKFLIQADSRSHYTIWNVVNVSLREQDILKKSGLCLRRKPTSGGSLRILLLRSRMGVACQLCGIRNLFFSCEMRTQ